MCGIIGYTGTGDGERAAEVLIRGLRRLEYRGYDSAGIAVVDGGSMAVVKRAGRVDSIAPLAAGLVGNTGIAHTRWATHGRVTDENAHPHVSCDGRIAIVHNGIVENHAELRSELESRGHAFKSETDSEVIAHLLEESLGGGRDPLEAALDVSGRLRGSFAFLAAGPALGDAILAVRRDSPLVIGFARGSTFASSDVYGFIEWTDSAYFMENGSAALVKPGGIRAVLLDGTPMDVEPVKVAFEMATADATVYAHHTLREIMEQPEAVARSLSPRPDVDAAAEFLGSAGRIFVVGAGTSYHAAMVARYAFADVAGVDVQPVLASEHGLFSRWMGEGSAVVAVSQSGETADVLEAVRAARGRGARVLAVVNVPHSTLERESDLSVNVRAGPEVGVAATKSFTAQLSTLFSIALRMAGMPGLDAEAMRRLALGALGAEGRVREAAGMLRNATDVYVVGRGIHYPMALEGALKVKELAYVHAEGLAAGELKHGTLAMVEEGTPVILINPGDGTYVDTISNGEEMKARGALVVGISERPSDLYDVHVPIPEARGLELPIVEAIPLQLLAYHTALLRGAEIDRPRNLAKSVTVK
ncbi:MAG: glutamine--fructose-6-phosphate transaminase (isomerizing) [Nitrososphaeria archaeon]